MPVEGEALQRLVRVSSAVATKVKLNLESFSDLKCLRQQKMVRLYNELKKSVEDAVAKWSVLMEPAQPKEEAYAAIIQTILDGLIECSLNPNEGIAWPINCTDAMAMDLIADVLRRRFNVQNTVEMQGRLADFLHEVLVEPETLPCWAHIELILKSCSEDLEAVLFVARISVKCFEGLVKLKEIGRGGLEESTQRNRREYANFVRTLNERCSGMIDIITTCSKFQNSAACISNTLFPTIQRDKYFLQVNKIEQLFSSPVVVYMERSIETMKAIVNDPIHTEARDRMLEICRLPVVVEKLNGVMANSASQQLVKSAYELAVAIQERFPQCDIFSSDVLKRIFDSDVNKNGTAPLIGRLFFAANNNPDDEDVFYRNVVEFFAKYEKNDDSYKYFIENCASAEKFTNWERILHYIEGLRESAENENHIKNVCRFLVTTVKEFAERIPSGPETMNDMEVDASVDADLVKLYGLLEMLPKHLGHFSDEGNFEIVGELMYLYKYIEVKMLLEDDMMEHTGLLLKIMLQIVERFTDFNAQCNTVNLLENLRDAIEIEDSRDAIERDTRLIIGKLHNCMVDARERILTVGAGEEEWIEISTNFMRFSAVMFYDWDLSPERFEQVATMCTKDLLVQHTYAALEDERLYGYNLVMMTSCYMLAASGKQQLPDSTKNVSEFVNLLFERLDQSENDVGFVILMAFMSLVKLLSISSQTNNEKLKFDGKVCARKMIQFAFDKLKSINVILEQGDHVLPNISTMCNELSQHCLQYATNDSGIDLIAKLIVHCYQRNRKETAIKFFRGSSKLTDYKVFSQIIASVLWNLPTLVLQKTFMVQVREILDDGSYVNNRIDVLKAVATYLYSWFSVPWVDRRQKKAQEKNREMETIRLVSEMLVESAELEGHPIEFTYRDYDGKQHVIKVSPDIVGVSQQRQQRKRVAAEGSSGEVGTRRQRRE